jgi:4'-phosphopantetheinyl transferase
MTAPVIHSWPRDRAAALAALLAGDGPVLLALATPPTTLRDAARQQTRAALCALLADYLGCDAASVPLVSRPGEALRLDLPGSAPGISVSHEAGISLIAIDPHGIPGIDVMRIEALPDWRDVARDYLGAAACRAIETAAPSQRAQVFAAAWTRMEASLKCLGLALAEWTPALQRELERCTAVAFAPAPGIVAALAWRKPSAA